MKTTAKKYTMVITLILTLILLCSSCTSKNVRMGLKSCEKGDYKAAMEFYKQEINDGKANDSVKTTYNALLVYLKSKEAYDRDDMAELSKGIEKLKNTDSTYPTETEINELQKQYETRINEINSYDKLIEKVSAMFSDVNNITDIKNSCDELLKKNITAEQKSKVNDIKNNADSYIDIKNSYDNSNYSDVIKKVSALPETYKDYATKSSIEKMNSDSKKKINERAKIDEKLKSVRDNFNSGKYDSALSTAVSLLKMNLTEEERKEIEKIKTTSEQKTAQSNAAVEKSKTTNTSSSEQEKKTYPEPEEYTINGASANAPGMAEVKSRVKKVAKENGVYLRYIENETDGSLYMEISCKNNKDATLSLNNKIANAIKGSGFKNTLMLTYTDISKSVDEKNRVIFESDIEPDGSIQIYHDK